MGAIAVIIGLYIVLWGKAKDVDQDMKRRRGEEVDDSSEKKDIEQPLLCDETIKYDKF